MSEDNKIKPNEPVKATRRAFVTTAAQVAVTAPAVAMILTASTKSATAATDTQYVTGTDTVFGPDDQFDDGGVPGDAFTP